MLHVLINWKREFAAGRKIYTCSVIQKWETKA